MSEIRPATGPDVAAIHPACRQATQTRFTELANCLGVLL